MTTITEKLLPIYVEVQNEIVSNPITATVFDNFNSKGKSLLEDAQVVSLIIMAITLFIAGIAMMLGKKGKEWAKDSIPYIFLGGFLALFAYNIAQYAYDKIKE